MSDDVVLVGVDEGVATITLNRPKARNALNRAVRTRLPRLVTELEADPTVDVMILTGTDPAFSAGVDLKEFGSGEVAADGEGFADMGGRDPAGKNPWRGALPPRTKPLIGAINGVAVTGGLEVALACDFLVASDLARFADTHARVGVMPGWGLTVLLPQRIGVARAREMSITGNFVDAHLAYDWGLVNHVVAHADLLPFCRKLAADCATIDQAAVRRMLATYDEASLVTEADAWTIEGRVSREWEGAGFDPAEIEKRRAGIVARGREQTR
ncbi:MAG TPA: enoyl-CoA hydratase [Acidimicrobiia bacterium]|nr:enoyl-CoA hydratase [Acidimicrobiia bacterium]